MAEKPTYEELAQRVKDLESETLRSRGAEEEMRASEEKFFKAFHNGPLLMTISSIKDGRYLDVNERFISITGYSSKETIGTTSVELGLISQDDREILRRELLENGHVRDMELTLHKKNGELFYCLYCGEIITVGGKQRLLSIAQDITGQKRAANGLRRTHDELEIRVEERTNELTIINEQLSQEIDERRQAEEQLRLSEDRYHTVYNVAPLAFVVWDCDCLVTDWNRRAEEMFGWSADEVLGRNFFEFLIPEGTRPHVEQIVDALFADALPRHSINENLTKSGEIIFCEWNNSILYDKEGHVRGALSLALDITERKRTEEALMGSEGKYRSLFENANDSIFIIDPVNFTILDANENAINRLGYSREELHRLTINDIAGSGSVSSNRARVRELIKEGSIIFEHTQRHKNGQEIPVEISSKIISYNGRKVIQAFVRDITDRKRTELALLESEKRLSQIIHGNSIATFVIDNKHKISHWNMACENLTGVSSEEMLGTQNQWRPFYKHKRPTMADLVVDNVPDDIITKYYSSKYQCSTIIEEGAYEAEDFFPQLGETGKWLFFTAAPLKDANGEIFGAIETLQDITDRKQAEEAITKAHSELDQIFNVAADGMRLINKDFEIIRVNKTFMEMTGLSKDALLGSKCYEVFPGPTCHTPKCTLSQIFSGEKRVEAEMEKERADGRKIQCIVTAIPFLGPDGSIVGIIEDFKDISDRKQAEEALRQSEEKFRSIFEISGAAIATLLPDGNFLEVNPAFCKFLGYNEAELLKLTVDDITHPDDRQMTRRSYEEMKAGQRQSFNYEKRYLRKDGSTVWGHADVVCVSDNTSGPMYCVGLMQDITARKQTEVELQSSRKMLRAVLDTIPVRVFWKDRDLRYLGCNINFAKDAGLNLPEAIIGKDDYHLSWLEQAEMYRADDWQVIESGTPKLNYEEPQVRPDGTKSWVKTSKIPLQDNLGNIFGVLGCYEDITERKKMEQALQTAHDDLEKRVEKRTAELKMTHDQLLHSEKLSAIGRLSASIAHEFNNPLFGIRNVLGGIKKRAALDEEDTELVDMALQECDRIKYLIQDLRDFNRPTSGIKAPVDIHKTIDSILLLFKNEFKSKKIMVAKDYTTNTPNICAVGDQIKQVLLNMLNNASDAMSKSGGTITIITHLLNKMIAIHIQDTGTGIKPEDMDHIFEPFFTTKPEVKGTGLGLSVSYGIIKRHGGRIDVLSEVGKGSIFTIILPIEEASK